MHHYQGKITGDVIQFVMQTEGGYSEHLPVKFEAHSEDATKNPGIEE